MLEFYFACRFFLKIYDLSNERFATLLYRTNTDITVKLFCVDPSIFIRSSLNIGTSSSLFSATLSPFSYFENTLGINECKHISLYSPFDSKKLCILCAGKISTKYDDRESTLDSVAELIYIVQGAKRGNYIAFFPSYKYMQQAYERFTELYPNVKTLTQRGSMSEESREDFLSQFSNAGEILGFCVLGGIFSEGIDLTGERLIGTIIIGVGLPQISAEQNELRSYYEAIYGDGFAYAYQHPGFNKVLQAAGRVIRTSSDKGVVLLIDSRYPSARYTRLFPHHWQHCKFIRSSLEAKNALDLFWSDE